MRREITILLTCTCRGTNVRIITWISLIRHTHLKIINFIRFKIRNQSWICKDNLHNILTDFLADKHLRLLIHSGLLFRRKMYGINMFTVGEIGGFITLYEWPECYGLTENLFEIFLRTIKLRPIPANFLRFNNFN